MTTKININEDLVQRGMNNLYHQITFKDETFRTIEYSRNITGMLHETPIFSFFKILDGGEINTEQCKEYEEKLKTVIKMLEQVNKIY